MRISDWSSDVCSSDLPTSLHTARWVEGDDPLKMKRFLDATQGALATDQTGAPVFLARNAWHLERAAEDRSEERRVGKGVSVRVDLGGRRIIKKKNKKSKHRCTQ